MNLIFDNESWNLLSWNLNVNESRNEYDNESWNEKWNKHDTYMKNSNLIKAETNMYANDYWNEHERPKHLP